MRNLVATLVIVAVLPGVLRAQAADPVVKSAIVANPRQVLVVFSSPLTSRQTAPHRDTTRVRLVPDNVMPTAMSQNQITGDLTASFLAVPSTATRICFDQVEFTASGATQLSKGQVCGDLSRDPAAVIDEWIAAFKAVPKSSRDKDVFASGFVTAAPDESAGGGDIAFNPSLSVPNLNAFLVIKKATADEGDARNFEAGARYRFTATWKPSEIAAMAAETDPAALNKRVRARQRNLLAGWLVDIAGKLEADPTEFDVTNLVAETSVRVQTMTKRLIGQRGYWRGFVLPAGFEGGQSLGTTPEVAGESGDAAATPADPPVNRIARYKGGVGLTLYYDNPRAPLLRRIEMDINGVVRQLFLTESRFNSETKKTDSTDKGLHAYGQADLKVFVGATEKGRFGFKVSYNRGRLPPVFAEVKSVDFGFVMESADGNGQRAAER